MYNMLFRKKHMTAFRRPPFVYASLRKLGGGGGRFPHLSRSFVLYLLNIVRAEVLNSAPRLVYLSLSEAPGESARYPNSRRQRAVDSLSCGRSYHTNAFTYFGSRTERRPHFPAAPGRRYRGTGVSKTSTSARKSSPTSSSFGGAG